MLPDPSKNADALQKLVGDGAPEAVTHALFVCVTPSSSVTERQSAIKTALACKLGNVRCASGLFTWCPLSDFFSFLPQHGLFFHRPRLSFCRVSFTAVRTTTRMRRRWLRSSIWSRMTTTKITKYLKITVVLLLFVWFFGFFVLHFLSTLLIWFCVFVLVFKATASKMLLSLAGVFPECFRVPEVASAVMALLSESPVATRTAAQVLSCVTAAQGSTVVFPPLPTATQRALRRRLATLAAETTDTVIATHVVRVMVQVYGVDSTDLAATADVRRSVLGIRLGSTLLLA